MHWLRKWRSCDASSSWCCGARSEAKVKTYPHAAPEIRDLLGRRPRLGEAAHEQQVVQVGIEEAHQGPPAARQLRQIGPPAHAEDHEAQVQAQRGGPDHPDRRAAGHQRCHRQLGGAGKHGQRHQHRHPHRQAAVDHRHAGDQAPGADAQRHADHVAGAAGKLGVPDQGTRAEPPGLHGGDCPTGAAGSDAGRLCVAAGFSSAQRGSASARRSFSQPLNLSTACWRWAGVLALCTWAISAQLNCVTRSAWARYSARGDWRVSAASRRRPAATVAASARSACHWRRLRRASALRSRNSASHSSGLNGDAAWAAASALRWASSSRPYRVSARSSERSNAACRRLAGSGCRWLSMRSACLAAWRCSMWRICSADSVRICSARAGTACSKARSARCCQASNWLQSCSAVTVFTAIALSVASACA